MTGQPWLVAAFAIIMIGTAAYCLTRIAVSLRRRRPTDRQVDGMHVLMGVAMAGMLMPRLRLPWTGGWEIIFVASAAVFVYRIARVARSRRVRARAASGPAADGRATPGYPAASRCHSHDAQHLLGCAAMLYMLVFIAPVAARTGLPGSAAFGMLPQAAPDSAVPLMLAVALLACVVWTADRMSSMAPAVELAARPAGPPVGSGAAVGPPAAAGPVPLSPRLSACCEIATGLTMGYMLITMLT